MEKIILIQALVHLSAQLPDLRARLTFLGELVAPTHTLFTKEDFDTKIVKDVHSFIRYLGLNDNGSVQTANVTGSTNRKLLRGKY